MMKDSVTNYRHIFFVYYLLFICIFCYTEEYFERQLEKNTERVKIENYFLANTKYLQITGYTSYPIPYVIVYCYDGYYSVFETKLDYKKIGMRRYFFDYKVNENVQKLSRSIATKNIPLKDFITKYLVKNIDGQSYSVYGMDALFVEDNIYIQIIDSILFAAQYNYDFLILSKNGKIKLYLPDSYKNLIIEYRIDMGKGRR